MQKGKKPDRPEASPKANASDTNTEKDRDKEAFMQLMKPRRQKQLWANDDVVASVAVETVTQPKKKGKSTEAKRKPAAEATGKAEVKKRKREDLGGLIEEQRVESVPSRKPGGQGILLKKTHIRFIEDEDEEEEQRGEEAHEQKKQPELPAGHPTALSDLDYMRSKMSASFPDNEEDDDDEEDEEQEEEDEEGEEGEEEESKEQNGNGQSDDHDESGEDAEAMEIERTTDSDEEEAPKANKRKRNSEEEEEEEEEEEGTGEEETGEEESEEQGDGEKGEGKDREEAVADEEEEAAVSGRLFVRNLPYTVSEEELKALFSRYGRLAEVRLPQEAGGRTRGYAFVTYLKPQDAARALQALDASIFQVFVRFNSLCSLCSAAYISSRVPRRGG
jgi:multiple RNA-binding domain-containing protein 1